MSGKKKGASQGVQPKLRFPEFRDAEGWEERPLSEFLKESRVLGSSGDIAKKITVKLWGKGVFKKEEATKGSENTQYYRRRSGQFIYSKLDFLNGCFGIIPDELDGFETTVDLPCFDIDKRLNSYFLLEYIKRKDFYKKFGEIADGGRKAKRIHAETFLSIPIAIPPLSLAAEQQKIADCLSSLDELMEAEGQKLEALQQHKKGLMQELFPAEGETIPKRRFPEFREAEGWEENILSLYLKFQPGFPFDSASFSETNQGLRLVRNRDLKSDDKIIFYTKPYKEEFVVNNGDVLVGMDGDFTPVVWNKGKALLNQRVARILPIKDNDLSFLHYFLTIYLKNIEESTARTTVKHLSHTDVERLTGLMPNPKEQQKIADCLSSIDDLIAAQTQKLDSLRLHKKGLMQQLFPAVSEAS